MALDQFVVESVSLPDDLQKLMDQRIGLSMAGDLGRLTQFEAAESLEEAAQNPGSTAGMGVGLGAGVAMAQALMGQVGTGAPLTGRASTGEPSTAQPRPAMALQGAPNSASAAPAAGGKLCIECGKPLPEHAKFCPECGRPQ